MFPLLMGGVMWGFILDKISPGDSFCKILNVKIPYHSSSEVIQLLTGLEFVNFNHVQNKQDAIYTTNKRVFCLLV